MKLKLLPTLLIVFSTALYVSPLYAEDEIDEDEAHDVTQEIEDPLESMNRGIFWFNDQVDIYALEPVARGYDDITPTPIRDGVHNFFVNLRYPMYLVSDVVQFKFTQAAEHTGRFLINSTIGLFGFIDVAKHLGLEDHREDFGLALAYHGLPPGPYLVLPFWGPSNLRDGVGRVVDFFLDPFVILNFSDVKAGVADRITYPGSILGIIDTRAGLLEAVEAAKSSSVDYYLFMQSAYYQYRHGLLYDGNPPGEEEEDLESNPFGDDLEVIEEDNSKNNNSDNSDADEIDADEASEPDQASDAVGDSFYEEE